MKLLSVLFLLAVVFLSACTTQSASDQLSREAAVLLVQQHALAWQTGDENLLDSILHENLVFAYPGRRLNKEQTLEDLRAFKEGFSDVNVYIHGIIVDAENVAVEWQFASTKNETGKRSVVSDAIIGKIKDGKIILWKEYLDGRVKNLQADGNLLLDEGMEPFPWPRKASEVK